MKLSGGSIQKFYRCFEEELLGQKWLKMGIFGHLLLSWHKDQKIIQCNNNKNRIIRYKYTKHAFRIYLTVHFYCFTGWLKRTYQTHCFKL